MTADTLPLRMPCAPARLRRSIPGPRPALRLLALACSLTLAGCAGFSADGGMDTVAGLARDRVGHEPRLLRDPQARRQAQARVDELLRAQLTADAAVELALLNHPGLQARLLELGVAEADLVEAGRLRNPVFGFLDVSRGASYKIERSLVFDLMGLLTLSQRVAIERGRFEQAQVRAAAEVVALATQARRAWVAAVASRQLVEYAGQVMEAADASAELARRMARAGNFSRLAQMREQTFHVEAVAQLARASQQARADRERLIRALGLPADDPRLALPDHLPELPAAASGQGDVEQLALQRRLDLLTLRRETETLGAALNLDGATRFVDSAMLGAANLSEGHDPRRDGFAIALPLPLFDTGEARLARSQARLEQARRRLAQGEVDARSQARESHAAYLAAWEVARHYRDEVVPLARQISEEMLLRYNGMLIGTFELLADARTQVRSVIGAVEALRDFWLADTDLQIALTAGAPDALPGAGAAIGPARSGASGASRAAAADIH